MREVSPAIHCRYRHHHSLLISKFAMLVRSFFQRSRSTIRKRLVFLLLSLMSVDTAVATTSKALREPRIVGGSNANRASFPATVLLGDRYEDLVCGATLISPTLVLTAAHCQEGVLTFALIGEYDTRDVEAYQSIPIVQELPHPQYDHATLEFDMMLLRLEYPVEGLVQFQRLNSDPNIPVAAAGGGDPLTVTAVGWGYTRNGGTASAILQEVTLGYVPNDECNAKEDRGVSYQGEISDNMMCTFAVGKDTCYGDSGGPILLDDENIFAVQGVQIGIVSWGPDPCAHTVFPGVNTRVSSGYDWIRQWVCAIDGGTNNQGGPNGNAPNGYQCDSDATYSPMPTPAPAVPTVSPAPTSYMIRLWIEIYLDESAFEVSWTLKDLTINQDVVLAESPDYEFEDNVVHVVDVWPSRNYQFTIQDTRGNGISDQGYYKISMGNVGDDLEIAKGLLFDVGRFGYERTYTFEIPDRVLAPSRAATPIMEPAAAPSTTITATTPPPAASCRNVGSLCVEASDCCSNRCRLGSCQKAIRAAKLALSGDRGGGAGAGATRGQGGNNKLVRGRRRW